MDFPSNLKYSKDHEWLLEMDGNLARIGVTSYAIEQLGDIVHIEVPEVGDNFDTGAAFGTIESTKTVSDLYLPVGGRITAINDKVVKNPESLQDDAYDEGWLVEIDLQESPDFSALLDADDYEVFVTEESEED